SHRQYHEPCPHCKYRWSFKNDDLCHQCAGPLVAKPAADRSPRGQCAPSPPAILQPPFRDAGADSPFNPTPAEAAYISKGRGKANAAEASKRPWVDRNGWHPRGGSSPTPPTKATHEPADAPAALLGKLEAPLSEGLAVVDGRAFCAEGLEFGPAGLRERGRARSSLAAGVRAGVAEEAKGVFLRAQADRRRGASNGGVGDAAVDAAAMPGGGSTPGVSGAGAGCEGGGAASSAQAAAPPTERPGDLRAGAGQKAQGAAKAV
ncbi:unnamed protein product, partial [Prorocentrum cordatum]